MSGQDSSIGHNYSSHPEGKATNAGSKHGRKKLLVNNKSLGSTSQLMRCILIQYTPLHQHKVSLP